MTMSSSHRAALWLATGVAILTGFCTPSPTGTPEALPAITMTSGGGFDGSSQTWVIGTDGSWTWLREDKSMGPGDRPSPPPARSGRLTEAQRAELALLATDPQLRGELRADHDDCTISDGPAERLTVGPVKYLASWCDEFRPRIQRLRERITALTTGA